MTSRDEPQRHDILRPVEALEESGADPSVDEDGDERPDELPEHERDDDRTVGGGVMSMGGTTVDRGTGTLGGQAQGAVDEDADDSAR